MLKAFFLELDMGATTSEGTGHGSAPPKKKIESLGVKNLIGPKIIVAGILSLKETTQNVEIDAPIGNTNDYCILLTGSSSITPYISRSLTAMSREKWQFEVTAGYHDVVYYAVLKIGTA